MNFPINLIAGWAAFLGGIVSGAFIGLHFHDETWLGGYSAFPRRLVRLGHIAFFGLGLINILFALSVGTSSAWAHWAASLLIVASFSMPLLCFLTAWKAKFRFLFFVPTTSAALSVVTLLIHLL